MLQAPQSNLESNIVRFGVFEFRLDTLTLSKYGLQIRLQEQPARVLALLVRNAGQIVTRESLKQALWPEASFGEFDSGLNTALSKVRSALGDSGLRPNFIERVPRQGYRFVAPIIAQSPTRPVLELMPEPAPPQSSPDGMRPGRRTLWIIGSVVASLCLVGGGLAAGLWLSERQAGEHLDNPVRFSIRLPVGHTLPADVWGNAVGISADGSTIGYLASFGSNTQVFVKRLDEAEFRPVGSTVGAIDFNLSPDGHELVFATRDNKWMRTKVAAGASSSLVTTVTDAQQGALWAANGALYVNDTDPRIGPVSRESRIYELGSSANADPWTPGNARSDEWLYAQHILPNGWLLASRNGGPQDRSLLAISPIDKKRTVLVEHAMGGSWLPSGHLVHWRDGSLFAVPFSLADMRALGPGVPVLAGVAPQRWRGGQASISSKGDLVYLPAPLGDRTLVWVDRSGKQTPLEVPPARYTILSLSRSGKQLLLQRTDTAHAGIWLYDTTERSWAKLAAGNWTNSSAVWSPDEQAVAFTATLQGENFENLYIQKLNAAGSPERIAPSPRGQFATAWSDNAGLIFTESDREGTHLDVYRMPKATGGKAEALVKSTADDAHATISPDGLWVAWASNISGQWDVYARLLSSSAAPIRLSRDGGTAPLWSPAGNELFYRTKGALWSVALDGNRFHEPQKLFDAEFTPAKVYMRHYAVSGDGSKFLFAKESHDPDDFRRIQVVLNWRAEVERLLSGGNGRGK